MEQKSKKIPQAVVERLPIYYRYIKIMIAKGKRITTSAEIARKAGNTDTQVRQDFFMCGGLENYHTECIEKWLAKTLGIDNEQHIIVIGAGNLGRAIISCKDFEKDKFFIDAAFDSNPAFEGMNLGNIPIINISLLDKYLSANKVDIAIIATPADVTKEISEKLIESGIKGIWNFSPCDLQSTNECIVKNTSLTDSLLTLSFRMQEKGNQQ